MSLPVRVLGSVWMEPEARADIIPRSAVGYGRASETTCDVVELVDGPPHVVQCGDRLVAERSVGRCRSDVGLGVAPELRLDEQVCAPVLRPRSAGRLPLRAASGASAATLRGRWAARDGRSRRLGRRLAVAAARFCAAYLRTYVRMPSPFPVTRARLDRALSRGDLAGVRAAARELPSVVTLADAVLVLVLMLEADDPAFEAAAVRWLARFAGECAGVTLGEAQAALEALTALPAADARTTLAGLLTRHGLG
jgi:hypothetical protein